MNKAQEEALADLHRRYGVAFDPSTFHPQFDLPAGWVAGWVGGPEHSTGFRNKTIYVGVSPEGDINS